MTAGVSVSSNINGEWTKPVALNIINEYNYSQKANYFLTDNRQTLLMSVERQDSYGDRDLYVTFAKSDNIWTEPLNLGDVVNTAGEESAPFLASDDKTFTSHRMDSAGMEGVMSMSRKGLMILGQNGLNPKTWVLKLILRWKTCFLIYPQQASLPTIHGVSAKPTPIYSGLNCRF